MTDGIVTFRPLEDEDIPLLSGWLRKPYILKWYKDEQVWPDEVRGRFDEFSFVRHFIAEIGGRPFGFCQYYDYSLGGGLAWRH